MAKTSLLKQLVAVTGPTSSWKGNCYGMACAMVKNGLVEGTAVYGHWRGPVSPKSIFHGNPVIQHGWVLMPDGQVCDPTRWEFEGKRPYIYIGPSDHYDEGGNKLREIRIGGAPPWDPEDDRVSVSTSVMDSPAWSFIEDILKLRDNLMDDDYEPGMVNVRQLAWVANLPPSRLGKHAPAIYAGLEKLKLRAFIPIDNYRMVQQGRGYG
jgi:hypothetical protein